MHFHALSLSVCLAACVSLCLCLSSSLSLSHTLYLQAPRQGRLLPVAIACWPRRAHRSLHHGLLRLLRYPRGLELESLHGERVVRVRGG